jgi:DNA topoisomerase-3
VPLSEAIIKELLETGKTKEKVTGFNSKAGNVFDSCLKYEDERISFDFDNPGSQSLQKQETEGQSEVQTAVQENGAQQMQQAEQGGTETQQAEQNAVQSKQSQRTDSEPDGADDFYAAMANEAAVFQEEEEQEWIAGSNFLDEFMP